MQTLFDAWRLAGTGYLSLLPVGRASRVRRSEFPRRPPFLHPQHVRLAIEAVQRRRFAFGVPVCRAPLRTQIPRRQVPSTNCLTTRTNSISPVGTIDRADMGASPSARRLFRLRQSRAVNGSERSLRLRARTLHDDDLWCYLSNTQFKGKDATAHLRRLTGQANQPAFVQAIITQKLPERTVGYNMLNTGSPTAKRTRGFTAN